MNKKLIFLIGTVFVVGASIIFFLQHSSQNNFSIGGLSLITDEELNEILSLTTKQTGEGIKQHYGFTDLNESFLINLVHIVKEGSNYKASCRFGPAYKTANLYKLFPEEPVSMGQIRKCDLEIAKTIDEAIKSPEIDCRVFASQVPSSLTDYYFLTIALEKEHEVTQEWIDQLTEKWRDMPQALKCFEPYKNLIGERISKVGVIIVDLNKNIVYF